MIRYYKLFDLLNRRGMKKSDLREILSSRTVAKLSKGENITTDVINKICLYLGCQPSDIMEVVEVEELIDTNTGKVADAKLVTKTILVEDCDDASVKETYLDEGRETHLIDRDDWHNNKD